MKNHNSMAVCFWALFVFLIIAVGNAIADQAQGTETQITTNKSSQDNPDIYGDRIVWQDDRNGNWDIYMYDLSTHKEIQITTNKSSQYSPEVYKDRIVWVDERNGNPDIYLQNLTNKKQTRITTSGKAYNPKIDGNRIVWVDGRNGGSLNEYNSLVGNWDIYMYDISTGKETKITTNESNQRHPDIFGDRIVWKDDRNMDWEHLPQNMPFYMYNLSTSVETPIYTSGYYVWDGPNIYGDRIVWMEEGPSTNYVIYTYNLSTSTEKEIIDPNYDIHSYGYDSQPAIYGSIIVLVYSAGSSNQDIYMYDLSTSTETRITTNESYKRGPAIYGNRIVWTDYRNGDENPDIYMFTISGKEPAPKLPVANFTSNFTNGYVPLSVQFTDLSKNATGRSWDFENDGKVDSTDETPVHVYTVQGNYTVNFTANNENGTDSKTLKIVVQAAPNEDKVLPVADFSTSVTSGYAPLSIQFTDLSQNATSRNWDFNSDGIADSSDASPIYTYTTPGTYTATLTVSNTNGTSSKTVPITVLTESSSDGSGRSSGSSSSNGGDGGGGDSPEPQSNVEVKELSQTFISSGKPAKFDFTKNATCIVYVSFDSKKTVGKTTAIAEMLKGKSTLVSELSAGEVYKYFNLWVGNSGYATSKNIENPLLCFKVEKSWIKDKNIDPASIILNRYSEKKWGRLPTNLSGEDDRYLYFTAKTPGFSPFAITDKKTAKEDVTEKLPKPNTQGLEQNSTAANVDQTLEKKENTSITGKESKSTPGFEIFCGVFSLLGVFLCRKG